ncbi:MAG TPA: hypothetical protein ENO27_01380 [Caldithrix sp.]|nr:hypothetical protein [Caldithrix sp.]
MIRIQIPNNNIPERKYIINIIFSEFLGLNYSLHLSDTQNNYLILFGNCEIVIRDLFFNFYRNSFSYLGLEALPKKISFLKNVFSTDGDIPVIYGTDELKISENKIICGIDIFASSFFLLTRWEENVNKVRDLHHRFPGSESIAFRNNFLHRPVVNEYVNMLWNMLKRLGFQGERRKKDFELVLTHDIDALTYVSFRTLIGDIIIRRNTKLAIEHSKYLYRHDPYDTYDFLMTSSEKLGLKSHFYFMASNYKKKYDTGYYLNRSKFKTIIRKIKKRGHIIGFHPGYYTYDDNSRWSYEKQLLENAIQQEILEGRQHYLRMDVTKTLPIWDKNSMKIDSTLGFADKEGFRCGTGDLFSIFDFLNRKQLQLKERPLILMDGTLRQYQQYTQAQVSEIIKYYINIGNRYNTGVTMLFHNSSFFREWKGYDRIYRKALNI